MFGKWQMFVGPHHPSHFPIRERPCAVLYRRLRMRTLHQKKADQPETDAEGLIETLRMRTQAANQSEKNAEGFAQILRMRTYH